MKKRAIALLTALAMSLSLFTGCGQKEEAAPATEAATEAAKETEAAKADETPAAEAGDYAALVEKLGDDKTIRLATPGNYAPFTIYDEATKEWSGFEIALWQIMAEKAGLELELVQLDNPATFAELDLGRVDTVAKQISITPARQEKYDFTQPFFFSPYCLTVREDNDEIKTWADMEGKTMGLIEGSAMNEFIAMRDPDNKVKKNIYEGHAHLQEVNLGRVDAIAWAYLVLPYTMEKTPELKLKSVDIENPIYTEVNAYPFARTDRGAVMLELIDTILGDMIEDGSYGKLCTEWFGLDVMETQPAIDYFNGASADTKEPAGKIIVASGESSVPNTYFEKGEHKGTEPAIWAAISEKTGLEVEYVTGEFNTLFGYLDSGKADTVGNCITVNEARLEKYIFSEGYAYIPEKLVVHSDRTDITKLADIDGLVCGYSSGSNGGNLFEQIAKEQNIEIEMQVFDSSELLNEAFRQGKVDVMIQAGGEAGYKIKNNIIDGRVVEEDITVGEKAFPFLAEDEELCNIVTKAIQEMKADGTLTKIYEEWYGADYSQPGDKFKSLRE